MNLQSRTLQICVLLLLLSVAGGAWYLQRSDASGPQAKQELVKVFQAAEVTTPQAQALSGRIEMSGVLVASEMATVRNKSGGTLLRLTVQEGQRVHRGQVLAEIDTRDLSARSAERDAGLKAAQRALQLSESQHKANQDLARQGFISDTALSSSLASLAANLAQLKTAEAAMASHNKLLEDATITAPFDGVISRRLVSVGEKIAPEQDVFTVLNPQRLEFKTTVDSAAARHLTPGQTISMLFEGHDQAVMGVIDRMGPGNDAGARALPVFVKIEASSQAIQNLRPGLMGTALYAYALPQTGMTLPVTAVQEEGGKNVVWVIHDKTLRRQTVTLGMKDTQGLRVDVLDGLKTTDTVLALRFEGLKEGTKVEVKP